MLVDFRLLVPTLALWCSLDHRLLRLSSGHYSLKLDYGKTANNPGIWNIPTPFGHLRILRQQIC